jgi:membrane protein DedA with SNARE-associated domain
MKKALKEFTLFAAFPITLLIVLGIFLLIYQAFDLPSYNEIIAFAQAQYEIHGYWVVFIAALAEGFLLINWFFPGSVVVVMGTLFATQGAQSIAITIALVMIGFFLMTMVNFYMGKYGWYKIFLKFGLENEIERMRQRIEKHGLKILVLSYAHPHVGSLTATAAGILQVKTKTFVKYSLIAFAFWATIWVSLVYTAGEQLLKLINFKNLIIIMITWIFVMGVQFSVKKLRAQPQE